MQILVSVVRLTIGCYQCCWGVWGTVTPGFRFYKYASVFSYFLVRQKLPNDYIVSFSGNFNEKY